MPIEGKRSRPRALAAMEMASLVWRAAVKVEAAVHAGQASAEDIFVQ